MVDYVYQSSTDEGRAFLEKKISLLERAFNICVQEGMRVVVSEIEGGYLDEKVSLTPERGWISKVEPLENYSGEDKALIKSASNHGVWVSVGRTTYFIKYLWKSFPVLDSDLEVIDRVRS